MFKVFRNIVLIGCVLILIAAYLRTRYTRDAAQQQTTAVQDSAQVERADLVLTVSASGPIRAAQELPMVFLAQGRVQTVNVVEGQRVLKGQTLATLDTRAESAALASAQLALDGAAIALKALTAAPRDVDLSAATVALDAARAQLAAAGIGYDPTRVKLAQLQIEIAKNQVWQRQLQRDQARALSENPQSFSLTLPREVQDAINQLPENLRNDINKFIESLLNSSRVALPSFGASAADAQIGVNSANYDVLVAQAQLAQAQNAHGDGASVAQAQAGIVQAQSALEKLKDGADPLQIQIAGAQLEAAQASVKLAEYNLSRSTLAAPFAGVVTKLNLTIGEGAPLDKAAVTLVDDAGFYVDIGVDELDVSKVAVGQKVTFTSDALPGVLLTGSVDRVASTAVEVAGVVTYPVHILLDANPNLRAGLSTTATVTVNQIKSVLRVRNRFVKLDRKTGKATVTVHTPDGKFKEVTVVLGLRNETYSEIKSGLDEGDTVVILPRENSLFGS